MARRASVCPGDIPVRMFLAQGDVGEEISRFAIENHIDAIVLVRRSRFQSKSKEYALGVK
jgi:hypothetical protein